jgi:hypothetical protein
LAASSQIPWRIPKVGSDMLPDMSDTDLELLARYTRQHSSHRNPMEADAEDDFAEVVRRYLALVYSAALRQVRASQLAEEVAQSTFIKLARRAAAKKPSDGGTRLGAQAPRLQSSTPSSMTSCPNSVPRGRGTLHARGHGDRTWVT